VTKNHGCHLAFLRLNHPNVAFLKWFARKIDLTIWPLFCPFLDVVENSIFQNVFWRNLSKTCTIL